MRSCKVVTTELPPCAISQINDTFIVGTYELNKETGERTGSLDTYSAELDLVNTLPTSSAVLDTRVQDSLLYTAHSTGEVRIWSLDGLQQQKLIQLGDDDHLVTQIAVNGSRLDAVLTTGELVVYDLESSAEIYRSKHHDLEAWTVVEHTDGNILTGGDDRALTYTDLRIPYMLWKVKPHEAGVTSILPRSDTNIWTGGYDDCLNFIDMRTKRTTESHNLGGGVWRLIPNSEESKVLACCMYSGLRILDAQDASVLGSLENHNSMVYGGSWLNNNAGFTCSFYDKMLQKWEV